MFLGIDLTDIDTYSNIHRTNLKLPIWISFFLVKTKNMSDRKVENSRVFSRRAFLRGAAALGASVATDAASNIISENIAKAFQCGAATPVSEDCPKSVGFVINGKQVIKSMHEGKEMSSNENPAGPVGVDLRVSLRQAPKETAMWGTFKPSENGASLVQMGPVKDGVEPAKLPLSLYGPRFEFSGCFQYDGEASVEECGEQVLRPGWVVDVERIIKEGGVRKFRYEYSFTISPDCQDAEREYIDTVTKEVVVPPTGPVRQPVIPPTTPGTGTPGRQPAQITIPTALPSGGDGSTPYKPNPNIPRMPGH